MKRFLVSIASTAGFFVLAAVPAWASSISSSNVQWSYQFTPSQSTAVLSTADKSGSVAFSAQPSTNATNTSNIVLTNLSAASTAPNSAPASFGTAPNGTGWSGTLTLKDTASGASQSFNVSGLLSGTISGGDPTTKTGGNTNITNQYTSAASFQWTAPDGNKYTVTMGKFTSPGPPTSPNLGSIAAQVTVTGTGNGGISGTAPEPSTLLLSCLGLGFLSGASWRKRRAAGKAESVRG